MDENKKPRSRVKKTVGEGKDFEKKGEGLGTGPVNNAGNYADRREHQASPIGQQRPAQSGQQPPCGRQHPCEYRQPRLSDGGRPPIRRPKAVAHFSGADIPRRIQRPPAYRRRV